MTKEDLTAIINNIRQAPTDVERNNYLLELDNKAEELFGTVSQLATQNSELQKQNQEYVKQNNALWLKISSTDKPKEETILPEQHEPQLKYDDLKF